jgi:hypothetical protein
VIVESMLALLRNLLGLRPAPRGWTVEVREDGRRGEVVYREAAGSLSFYWEFGGGDTIAIIDVGSGATWREEHPWTAGRRAEILRRVAGEVIRQKAPGHRAAIDHRRGRIYIR